MPSYWEWCRSGLGTPARDQRGAVVGLIQLLRFNSRLILFLRPAWISNNWINECLYLPISSIFLFLSAANRSHCTHPCDNAESVVQRDAFRWSAWNHASMLHFRHPGSSWSLRTVHRSKQICATAAPSIFTACSESKICFSFCEIVNHSSPLTISLCNTCAWPRWNGRAVPISRWWIR